MKVIGLCLLLVFLSGCAMQGEYRHSYDEFTRENTHSVALGKLILNKADGVFAVVSASFEEVSDYKENKEYFYNFWFYSESMSRQCPGFKKGSKVVFLIDGEPYEYKVAAKAKIIKDPLGLIMGGCRETNILVGSLQRDFLVRSLEADVVRFKLYGGNSNVEGRILKEELQEIRKLYPHI